VTLLAEWQQGSSCTPPVEGQLPSSLDSTPEGGTHRMTAAGTTASTGAAAFDSSDRQAEVEPASDHAAGVMPRTKPGPPQALNPKALPQQHIADNLPTMIACIEEQQEEQQPLPTLRLASMAAADTREGAPGGDARHPQHNGNGACAPVRQQAPSAGLQREPLRQGSFQT